MTDYQHEVPDDARSIDTWRDAIGVVFLDLDARHCSLVFFQHEVFICLIYVACSLMWRRNFPDDDVAKVGARHDELAVVVGCYRRHRAAVRVVDHVHETARLRRVGSNAAVTPA